MSDDEAIRTVVRTWNDATKAGDLNVILGLMTDDAVFMVPGREPFGREAFAEAFRAMEGVAIEVACEIVELEILGDWAFVRNSIDVEVTPRDGTPARRSGYTLTLFRKQPDGRWLLARDANLLTVRR